jgi:DNA modification methylase
MPVVSLADWNPVNPRLPADAAAPVYRYYAGFRPDFVRDALSSLGAGVGLLVLDPWNGSGTTTAVANEFGCVAYGFDRNPAMPVVAKANLLSCDVSASLSSLANEIVANCHKRRTDDRLDDDGLAMWFGGLTTLHIRRLEREIHHLLVDRETPWPIAACSSVSGISSLAAFFYVAGFRVIKGLLKRFRSSNPTWIRLADNERRVSVRSDDLHDAFLAEVSAMQSKLRSRTLQSNWSLTAIELASSTALPLMANVVDAIITSPPYCTRIDYIMASLPELAFLGYSTDQWRHLRDEMIGTLTVPMEGTSVDIRWGAACLEFLHQVKTHRSRASDTYYTKTHTQYFDSIFRSFGELHRVLRPGGACIMVVQDSYYKEVHNDLAKIFVEMTSHYRWSLERAVPFAKIATLAGINPRSKRYRSPGSATETVLAFRKAS